MIGVAPLASAVYSSNSRAAIATMPEPSVAAWLAQRVSRCRSPIPVSDRAASCSEPTNHGGVCS